jgi:hypothetical protein
LKNGKNVWSSVSKEQNDAYIGDVLNTTKHPLSTAASLSKGRRSLPWITTILCVVVTESKHSHKRNYIWYTNPALVKHLCSGILDTYDPTCNLSYTAIWIMLKVVTLKRPRTKSLLEGHVTEQATLELSDLKSVSSWATHWQCDSE